VIEVKKKKAKAKKNLHDGINDLFSSYRTARASFIKM